MYRLRITRMVLACVCLVVLSLPLWGQQNASENNGVLGYLDPRTGSFRLAHVAPVDDAAAEAAAAAATTRAGKLVFSFTITIASALPTTSNILCSASANLIDDGVSLSALRTIIESATVAATRTGSTAKCTVTIPYSWSLVTPTTDAVSLAYVVQATGVTTAAGMVSRDSTQSLGSIAVPLNGATTTHTIAVTL